MTKKKGSAKGKKARSKRVSVRPQGSSTVSSVAPSASTQASASSSKQALRDVLSDPDQAPRVLSDPDQAPRVLSDPDQAPRVLSDPDQAPPKARLEQKIDELDEKIEKKSKAARDGFASSPSIDDTSIPPVVEDEFFARGEAPPRVSHSGASGAFEPIHPDARGSYRKATPEARARRGELAKYVKAAVAVSAAILVIGFVKLRFFSAPESDASTARPASAHVQEPAALPVAEPPASEARPSPPPGSTPGVAQSPPDQKVDPTAATGDADKALQAKTDEPKPSAAQEKSAVPEKSAAQEKAAAQAALERNNAGAAISAGRRSVALDPTDAEAWLILGGAYQMQNRNGEAKAAFGSCVRQAKRGPVSECGQMIGQ